MVYIKPGMSKKCFWLSSILNVAPFTVIGSFTSKLSVFYLITILLLRDALLVSSLSLTCLSALLDNSSASFYYIAI